MSECRGIRGAITVENNDRKSILDAPRDLLEEITRLNNLDRSQVVAAWFTTTTDLNAEYPALAARQLGWTEVALLCAHEMSVPNSLPFCIRVLILVNTDKSANDIEYVYLRGAKGLRSHGLAS